MKSLFRRVSAFLRLGALAASISTLSAQQTGNSPVKIFIMVGQSNMLGHGNMSPVGTQGTLQYVVANDPGGTYQFAVDGAGDWAVRDDVWIKDQYGNASGLTAGYGSGANDANNPVGTNIGPELGFGHAMGAFYEEQILIVKAAWGGKSLGNDFLPPSSGPYPPPTAEGQTGFYYSEVLRLVDDAIDNLGTYFPDYNAGGGYEIAGFCWHQGWNDRSTQAFSAAYETNMANFIRDIRNDLGVPNLPFVIATSAMDGNGPAAYTQVELAQRAMTNTSLSTALPADPYTDFIGSVAVVDCRQTYNGWAHAGLDFWQDAANSPQNQGFHWNRNAKTYLNIGLAMADEMATLAPSPCPSNLQASAGAASGVTLNWLNWDNIPTSVRVLRDGVEVAAALPGSSTSFDDTAAVPGMLGYELVFTMPGDPCPPITTTFDGSITGLEAFRNGGNVNLTWTNAMVYSAIEIRRNGVVIEAAYSGTSESYIDTSPPPSGGVTYQVVPTTGTSAPAQARINPYWDGGSIDIVTGGDGASAGGSGTWDTTTLNWDEGNAPHVAWNNTSNSTAIFGGTAGTVTIGGGGVTVGAVQFDTANYIIDGGPLTFGAAGDISNGGTATIAADVAGSFGLSKTGSGILRMPAATYTFTGDISITGGTLDFSSASNDAVNRTLGGGNYAGNIDIASGATFQFWRNTGNQEFSGVISGGGNVRLAHKGTYTLSGANTYTGKTTVHGEFNGNTATLNVSSFNSVMSGSIETGMGPVATPVASSSLGAPTTAANGIVDIGRTAMQASAALNYTGAGETTDRVMNLVASGNNQRKGVNNLGSGTLTFTSPWIGVAGVHNNIIPITTNADMVLAGSVPDNFVALEKRGNAKLSLSGPCTIWNNVHLYAGTLEVDSEINDGGVYGGAITTGSGNGGINFIAVPAGTPLAVGMTIVHPRFTAGTTITAIVDINANPVEAQVSSNSDNTARTETGYIGFKGALGIINTAAANLRWRGNATLKYDGPDNSTNRNFTIDNAFTSTWEIITGSTLTVSGATTNTTGKLTKTGAGTLVLSGDLLHDGVNNVDAGTLLINGNSSGMTGAVNVNAGATLGGTGTIGGNVNIADTGKLAFDLSTNAFSHDKLEVGGFVDFAGTSTLTISSDGGASPGLYTLVTDTGTGISGLAPASVNLPTGWSATVSIVGNDLLLDVISTGSATSPYETWAASFSPADVSDPTLDFDSDTLSNLREFAFGTDPTVNFTGPMVYVAGGDVTTPGQPVLLEEGGTYYAVFARRKDHVAAGLTYTVQFSADLSSPWVASVDVPTLVTSDPSAGDIEAVRVPFPGLITTDSGPQKATFFRVELELAP